MNISGTPQQSRTDDVSITITQPPFAITTTSLADGKINQVYSGSISTENGMLPLSYSITSGSLPPGFSITPFNDFYDITGTPTATGQYDFTFQATDNSSPSQSDSKSYTLKINIRITTTTLSDGQVGEVYAGTIWAEGGSAAYDWSVTSGNLPSGTVLVASSSFADIAGIPDTAGTYNFTIQAVDQLNPALTDSKPFSITVTSP